MNDETIIGTFQYYFMWTIRTAIRSIRSIRTTSQPPATQHNTRRITPYTVPADNNTTHYCIQQNARTILSRLPCSTPHASLCRFGTVLPRVSSTIMDHQARQARQARQRQRQRQHPQSMSPRRLFGGATTPLSRR